MAGGDWQGEFWLQRAEASRKLGWGEGGREHEGADLGSRRREDAEGGVQREGPGPSSGGADGGLELPQGAVELPGDFAQAGVVAAEQFGVQEGEGGKQGEADAEDQGDDRQSVVGHRLGTGAIAGPVTAGMQKAVRERPVLGEVIPSIVLDFPAAVPQLPDQGAGEDLRVQGIQPYPSMIGGLGL